MTGSLIYKSAGKTGASSNWYGRGLELQDEDGLTVGLVTATNRNGQGTGTSFEGVRVVNGANHYNTVRLELDASGSPVVEFGSAANITAWVNALGVNRITGNSSSLSNPVTSLPTAAWKRIGNISIGAGRWLLIFHVTFSANGSGRREIRLCTNGNDDYSGIVNLMCKDNRIAAPAACESVCTFTMVLDTAATVTYYLKAAQDSGSTLTVTARFSAIKLC